MKRNGYCSWLIEGPARAVIVRRNGNRYQVFMNGMMVSGFFSKDYPRKRDAVEYATWLAGYRPERDPWPVPSVRAVVELMGP